MKLVVPERESGTLVAFLASRPARASCDLARVEVIRAVRGHGPEAIAYARRALEGLHLIRLERALLEDAASLEGERLRSLDAIHVAAARALGDDLTALVSYDERMLEAGAALGLAVASPA